MLHKIVEHKLKLIVVQLQGCKGVLDLLFADTVPLFFCKLLYLLKRLCKKDFLVHCFPLIYKITLVSYLLFVHYIMHYFFHFNAF